MKWSKKGSISIFAAMSIMLAAAFLFVLLEAGRAVEMQKLAKINTESVLESVFAEYETSLWEMYHLLAFDAFGSGDDPFLLRAEEVKALSNQNLEPVALGEAIYGSNLLQMKAMEADFGRYRYLTDDDGKAFEAAVAAYMKSSLLMDAAQQVYGQYEAVSELLEDEESGEMAISNALDAMEENGNRDTDEQENLPAGQKVSVAAETGTPAGPELPAEAGLPAENPLDVVTGLQSMGILELVLEDTSKVSTAAVNLEETVSHRILQKGTGMEPLETDWVDYVLMQQYLVRNMGDYTNIKENRALSYELEYLICGNASDVENLKGTVDRLMLVREAANLIYLATDSAKQSEALGMATILAGASANPAVIEVVKWGILAAWAYVESIMDLRALLDGDKIPLIKSSSEWTSDLWGLAASLTSFGKAKSSENGLSYSTYAGILLFFQGERNLSYRGMDMVEASVRKQEGKSGFCLDHMVIDAELKMSYSYHTIFFGMDSLTDGKDRYYTVINSAAYSYRKAGV